MYYKNKDIIKQLPCHSFDIKEEQKLYIKENQEIKENEVYVAFFSKNGTEFKTNVDTFDKKNQLKLLEINIFPLEKLEATFKDRNNDIFEINKSIGVFLSLKIDSNKIDSEKENIVFQDTEDSILDNDNCIVLFNKKAFIDSFLSEEKSSESTENIEHTEDTKNIINIETEIKNNG